MNYLAKKNIRPSSLIDFPPKLDIAKGAVQVSFTRAATKFIVQELDLTKMVLFGIIIAVYIKFF